MKFSTAIILVFSACCIYGKKPDEVREIRIEKTNLSTETIASISCDDFGRNFSWIKDTFFIKSKPQIQRMLNYLHGAKAAPEFDDIDTRAKMHIYYTSGKEDVLCFCITDVFMFNGNAMRLPSRGILNYLDSLPEVVPVTRGNPDDQ